MVRSDAGEALVNQITEFVDSRIREAMGKFGSASTLTAALLACLNITDEFFRYREDRRRAASRAVCKVGDLIKLIDLQFGGG